MTPTRIAETFLQGGLPAPAAPDEATWHTFWHDQGIGALPSVAMALRGGLSAQSLPQTFISGYQAALHSVFTDLPDQGWGAFVAAEAKDFAGTVLGETDGQAHIDGHKSWVGQSRHVTHLFVTARQGETVRIARLSSDATGLTLTHREQPGFLPGLSQGFAKFENARVDVIEGIEGRDFARAEPLHIMLACAAFLAGRRDEAMDAALTLTIALARYIEEGSFHPRLLASLDRQLQSLVTLVDGAGVPDWESDQKLFGMFSTRIQKRA